MRIIKVLWNAMPRTIRYEVQYRIVGAATWGPIQQVLTNYVDVLLEEGKSYQFRVRSVCPDETTEWSYLGVNVFSNDGACQTPTGMTVEQIPGTYDFRVTWDNSSNVSGWNFRYRKQGDLTWNNSLQTTPDITLSSLVIGATYEYQVQTICIGNTASDWGNIGYFTIRSSDAMQDCPVVYEDDWEGTINGRKDSGYTVKLNGTITFTGPVFPDEDSYTEAGNVGECCAPLVDVVIPVDNAQFKGEITITASGQIIVYCETYVTAPAISYEFNNLFYQGYNAVCPPPVPPQPTVFGTLKFTQSPGSVNGPLVMTATFNMPLTTGITFNWGFCVHDNNNPGVVEWCKGFPGADPNGPGDRSTSAVIGIGASSYSQNNNYVAIGAAAGYLTKVYIFALSGISKNNLQLAVGENYQLIFL